jgi:WD40 repeat protein
VTGRQTARLDDGAGRLVFGVSPDGLTGVMASGHRVKVVELFTQRPIIAVEHDHRVTRIHVGPNGKQVALESDKRLAIVHTATGRRVDLPERAAAIGAVSFTTDGAFVTVASAERADEAVVFDTASGAKQDRLPPSAPTAADEVPGTLEVVRRTSREKVQAIGPSPDGELLMAGTGDRYEHATVFQMKSGRRLARRMNAGQMASRAAFSPDGMLVALTAGQFLTVFEAYRGRSIVHLTEPGRLTRIAFSPDGTTAAGGFDEGRVIVVESETGRRLGRPLDCDRPRALAVATGGRPLAAGCYDGRLRVMNVVEDRITAEVPYRRVDAPIVLSRDGRFFFSVGDKGAAVFEAASGRTVKILGGDSVSAVALSPDGSHLAIAAGRGASVVDVVGGREPLTLRPDELIEGLAFSPDGKRVAIGGRSRLATVHEVDTGRVVTTVDHKEEEKGVLRVRTLAFSASGQLLATVVSDPTIHPPGSDSTVRVFHAQLGRELIRIPLRDHPHFLRFSADDAYLELAVGVRNIRLERYPLKAEDMAREACSWVGRNLTELEWSRYLGHLPYRDTCTELNRATGP